MVSFENINELSTINIPSGCKIMNIILYQGITQKSIKLIVDGVYSYLITKNGDINLYKNSNIIYSLKNTMTILN